LWPIGKLSYRHNDIYIAGSSTGTFPTPSDCTFGVGNMEVEEDVAVIEESFIAVNRHSIKQEQIPEDITFPDIKSEPDEVSYVCVCLLLDTLTFRNRASYI
jgi:hypothetical protein